MKWKVYIDRLHVYLRVATDVYLQFILVRSGKRSLYFRNLVFPL